MEGFNLDVVPKGYENVITPSPEPLGNASGEVVMSWINEEVKWHPDQKQIIRRCDEDLAFGHPAVKAAMKLKDEKLRAARQEYYIFASMPLAKLIAERYKARRRLRALKRLTRE